MGLSRLALEGFDWIEFSWIGVKWIEFKWTKL